MAIRLRPVPKLTPSTASKDAPPSRARRSPVSATSPESYWQLKKDPALESPMLMQGNVDRQLPGTNAFSFDKIFEGYQSTVDVYRSLAKPIVDHVVEGRHGTIFAYGQTGAGKTFTMQGTNLAQQVRQYGLVQLAVTDILEQMESKADDRGFSLKAQFFEIYNEQVRDLLGERGVLTIREKNDKGVKNVSVDASEEPIRSAEDVAYLLATGNDNRTSAATSMNARSSRSHAIFRLLLESYSKSNPATRQRSVLNLVDLAGSENSHQAGVDGVRKAETGKINQRYGFISGTCLLSLHH